ncbi:hypothetical protein KCU83_g5865, partial [Aureobasidium melanogenum]
MENSCEISGPVAEGNEIDGWGHNIWQSQGTNNTFASRSLSQTLHHALEDEDVKYDPAHLDAQREHASSSIGITMSTSRLKIWISRITHAICVVITISQTPSQTTATVVQTSEAPNNTTAGTSTGTTDGAIDIASWRDTTTIALFKPTSISNCRP